MLRLRLYPLSFQSNTVSIVAFRNHRILTYHDIPVYAMPEYSQSAYRHGDFVAKYGVFPLGEAQRKREEGFDVKDDDPVNVLATEARDFHLHNKVTYAFCAQM